MKKSAGFLLSLVLLLGIFAVSPMVLADSDDEGDNSVDVDIRLEVGGDDSGRNDSDDDEDDDSDDELDDDYESDDDDSSGRRTERVRVEERTRVVDANGNFIDARLRIEREVRENGEVRTKIRYKESNDGGDEIEVEVEGELEVEEDSENGRLRIRLENGDVREVMVLPDRASEIARAQFESRDVEVRLREVEGVERNRIVYRAEVEKEGRVLRIFRARARLMADVDAETGEILKVNGPWWHVFFRESSEVSVDGE